MLEKVGVCSSDGGSESVGEASESVAGRIEVSSSASESWYEVWRDITAIRIQSSLFKAWWCSERAAKQV